MKVEDLYEGAGPPIHLEELTDPVDEELLVHLVKNGSPLYFYKYELDDLSLNTITETARTDLHEKLVALFGKDTVQACEYSTSTDVIYRIDQHDIITRDIYEGNAKFTVCLHIMYKDDHIVIDAYHHRWLEAVKQATGIRFVDLYKVLP